MAYFTDVLYDRSLVPSLQRPEGNGGVGVVVILEPASGLISGIILLTFSMALFNQLSLNRACSLDTSTDCSMEKRGLSK
jgi:hypothetical protein